MSRYEINCPPMVRPKMMKAGCFTGQLWAHCGELRCKTVRRAEEDTTGWAILSHTDLLAPDVPRHRFDAPQRQLRALQVRVATQITLSWTCPTITYCFLKPADLIVAGARPFQKLSMVTLAHAPCAFLRRPDLADRSKPDYDLVRVCFATLLSVACAKKRCGAVIPAGSMKLY